MLESGYWGSEKNFGEKKVRYKVDAATVLVFEGHMERAGI